MPVYLLNKRPGFENVCKDSEIKRFIGIFTKNHLYLTLLTYN